MNPTLRPRLLIAFVGLLLLIAAMGVFALRLMEDLNGRVARVSQDNIPEMIATDEAQLAVQEFRRLQLTTMLESSGPPTGDRLADLLALQNAVILRLEQRAAITPEASELAELERLSALWKRYLARSASSQTLRGGPPAARALTGPAEALFAQVQDGIAVLRSGEQIEAEATRTSGERRYERARRVFIGLLLGIVLGTGTLGLWLLVIRPLRRSGASEGYRRRFHDALEMADTEDEALDLTGRSMGLEIRETSSELLLADSSQAHLYRALTSGPDPAGPGCPVSSPRSCAAVRRGQPTPFASSEAVGACPRLRDRPGGPCSALCTPVTVLGRTIGVLHATGPVGRPPDGRVRDVLEATASQIGSRLGVIRAMSQSQLQASTDPLTGLLNRRSLEDRVRDLRRARTPFVVAMADLDRFKRLNDSFGHETGDRALRLFSRTLAETVRVQDVVARYGGEEFVVVFPQCSTREAADVLERVRNALSRAVTSAEVPEFTFSVGVADVGPDESFHDALRAADGALMSAKRAGRDRTLIASAIRDEA